MNHTSFNYCSNVVPHPPSTHTHTHTLHNPLISSLGDKTSHHAQRSIHQRIWCNFRLLSSRFHARIFFLFLFLLYKMRSLNIEGLQRLYNFQRSLSIIPRLLYVTGEKKNQLQTHEKSLIDMEYSCRDLLLMHAICQTLRVTTSSVVDQHEHFVVWVG